jgi:hypothetical protein
MTHTQNCPGSPSATRRTYRTLQRAIARDDRHSIESRWSYGRAILADPRNLSASGEQLRVGVMEALIAGAAADGSRLSEREVRYRLQCARAYSTVNAIRQAAAGFETWTALVEAGFPSVAVDDTPSPQSVLDEIEQGDPQEFEQLALFEVFPVMVRGRPLAESSLGRLVAYADEMEAMTASFDRRDRKRREHLRELLLAVGGDLNVLYPDALAMLRATAP